MRALFLLLTLAQTLVCKVWYLKTFVSYSLLNWQFGWCSKLFYWKLKDLLINGYIIIILRWFIDLNLIRFFIFCFEIILHDRSVNFLIDLSINDCVRGLSLYSMHFYHWLIRVIYLLQFLFSKLFLLHFVSLCWKKIIFIGFFQLVSGVHCCSQILIIFVILDTVSLSWDIMRG